MNCQTLHMYRACILRLKKLQSWEQKHNHESKKCSNPKPIRNKNWTQRLERRRRRQRERVGTWRPAREERVVDFFLSLFWAGVLPIINPFAPFPDILSALYSKTGSPTRRDRERDFAEGGTRTFGSIYRKILDVVLIASR